MPSLWQNKRVWNIFQKWINSKWKIQNVLFKKPYWNIRFQIFSPKFHVKPVIFLAFLVNVATFLKLFIKYRSLPFQTMLIIGDLYVPENCLKEIKTTLFIVFSFQKHHSTHSIHWLSLSVAWRRIIWGEKKEFTKIFFMSVSALNNNKLRSSFISLQRKQHFIGCTSNCVC